MLEDLVVLAPQELERGHAHEDVAARPDQPAHVGQQALLVGEVLEDVEQQHDVEARGRERQRPRARARDGREPALPAVCEREGRTVDPDGADAVSESREHATRPAADVEEPEPGTREHVPEERGDEEALPDEPPVVVLEPAHLLDLAHLHRTRLGTRGAEWMQTRRRC